MLFPLFSFHWLYLNLSFILIHLIWQHNFEELCPFFCILKRKRYLYWNLKNKDIFKMYPNGFKTNLITVKQECIPVGCVPPTAVAVPGGSIPAPLGADTSLGSRHLPGEQTTPGADPPEWTPPRADTPREQTPPLLTESQTPVKTSPCPNFVAGGNKLFFRKPQIVKLDLFMAYPDNQKVNRWHSQLRQHWRSISSWAGAPRPVTTSLGSTGWGWAPRGPPPPPSGGIRGTDPRTKTSARSCYLGYHHTQTDDHAHLWWLPAPPFLYPFQADFPRGSILRHPYQWRTRRVCGNLPSLPRDPCLLV